MLEKSRHERIGVCINPFALKPRPYVSEVKKEFPIVDENGVVVETIVKFVKVKSSDQMAQFKPEDFSLVAYRRSGIDLRTININRSDAFTIDQLERLVDDVQAREKYVAQVLEQKKEREAWLQPVKTSETETIVEPSEN